MLKGSGKKILALLAAAFLVYLISLNNGFVWDDEELIANNAQIKSGDIINHAFSGGTFNAGGGSQTGIYYKPLMILSFGINYRLWENNTLGFHLFQLGLHLTNIALLYLLFGALFSLSGLPRKPDWPFFAALVFALHPQNVESVVYVSATQEPLFTVFGLSALLFLISKKIRKIKHWQRITVLSGLLLFSLFSKESGVLLIPIGALLSVLFVRELLPDWLLSSVLAFAGYLYMRLIYAGVKFSGKGIFPIMHASLAERLTTLPAEIFYYLKNFLIPTDLSVSQQWLVKNPGPANFWIPLLAVILVFAGSVLFAFKSKNRLVWFFLVWEILSFGLISNIFPIDMTVADRWIYFPMIGGLGIISVLAARLWPKNPLSQKVIFTIFSIFMVFWTVFTIMRCWQWRDGLALYSHDLTVNPQAFDLQNNLGVELFRAGKLDEACRHFEQSVALNPNWWTAYNNLGACYQHKGDNLKAEEMYLKSVEKGDYYLAYDNLAKLVVTTRDYSRLLPYFLKGQKLDWQDPNLAAALVVSYYETGQYDQALSWANFLYNNFPSQTSETILSRVKNKQPLFNDR